MLKRCFVIAVWALFLVAVIFGCDSGGSSGSDGDDGDDSAGDADTDTDTDADTDADGGAGGSVDRECLAASEGAPEPCALDQDADRHVEAVVNQVAKTVTPDFGEVPEGGKFTGDTGAYGEFGFYQEKVTIPIIAETREVACHTIIVKEGKISGTAYLPKKGGKTAEGKFPLIIVLAGFTASYSYYLPYSMHFVTHGFVVLGIDPRDNPMSASHDKEAVEISQAITWADESDDSPLKGRIDMTKIAVAGHSKGGKLSFFAAAIDPRVDIVIGWDPSNGGGPPCFIANAAPNLLECNALPVCPNCMADDPGVEQFMNAETLVLGEPRDSMVNPDKHQNSIHFYRGAPSPASLVYFNAGHVAPLPMTVAGVGVGDGAVIRINKAVQVALLLKRFKGMHGDDLDKWLPDTEAGRANLLAQKKVLRAESK